jgi:hypothetical protein
MVESDFLATFELLFCSIHVNVKRKTKVNRLPYETYANPINFLCYTLYDDITSLDRYQSMKQLPILMSLISGMTAKGIDLMTSLSICSE